MEQIFQNRTHAGQLLAQRLSAYAHRDDVLVLALPRGGVPVAYEVAKRLHAPLDVLVVRKLGIPGNPEQAMGAIASGGVRVLNDEAVRGLCIPQHVIDHVAEREEAELHRRERVYRGGRPYPEIGGKTVLLIDDGIATGATIRAAARAVRALGPERLVIAVPTAPSGVYVDLAGEADRLVVLITPEGFQGVGQWYAEFPQTTDEEVIRLLADARETHFTRTAPFSE